MIKQLCRYYQVRNLNEFIDKVIYENISFDVCINDFKALRDCFGDLNDLIVDIKNNSGECLYLLETTITDTGNLYLTLDNNELIFLNLKNKYSEKIHQKIWVCVLLDTRCVNQVIGNYDENTKKFENIDSEDIIEVDEKRIARLLEKYTQSKKDIYQIIKPFDNKEVLLRLEMEDYDDVLVSRGIYNVETLLHQYRQININELINTSFHFSIISNETEKYDRRLLNNNMTLSYQLYLYEVDIKFETEITLFNALQELEMNDGYMSCCLIFDGDSYEGAKGEVEFTTITDTRTLEVAVKILRGEENKSKSELISDFYENMRYFHKYKTKADFEKIINFDNYIPDVIDVYNVGRGNFIDCIFKKDKHLRAYHCLFDIGLSVSDKNVEEQPYTKFAIDSIKKINPFMVMLSHWHKDHIKMIFYIYEKVLDKIWIVPDLCAFKEGEMSMFAIRMMNCLYYFNKKNLYIIEKDCDKVFYDNGYIKLFRGECKETSQRISKTIYKYTNEKMNNFGLIMELSYNHIKALLCGDCDYILMGLTNTYDLLVVPHHGAKLSIPPDSAGDHSLAVICDGYKTEYPDIITVDNLDKKAYEIIKVSEWNEKYRYKFK